MTDRELELTELAQSTDSTIAIESAVALCKEFLFARKEFEKAELILFELAGFQGKSLGYIIELTLGQVYIGMGESTRAKRFLEIARASTVDRVRGEAVRLLETISG
jgi:hypothetical protein